MENFCLIFDRIKEKMKINRNKDIALIIIIIFTFILFINFQKSAIINIIVSLILGILLYLSLMMNRINKKAEKLLSNHSLKNSNSDKMDRLLKKYFLERKKLEKEFNYEPEESSFIKNKEKGFDLISRISKISENKKKIRNDTFSFKVGSSFFRDKNNFQTVKKKKTKKNIFNLGPLYKSSKALPKENEEKKRKQKIENIFESEKKQTNIFPNFTNKDKNLFENNKENSLFNKEENLLSLTKNQKGDFLTTDNSQKKEEEPLLNMSLNLSRMNSSKEETETQKQKSILLDKINTKNNLAPIEEIKEESLSIEEESLNTSKIPSKFETIKKENEKNQIPISEKNTEISKKSSPLKVTKKLDHYSKIVTKILLISKTPKINKKTLDTEKNKLLKFFSQICFEIDDHFVKRIQELVSLFESNSEKEEIYLFLVRSFILKIFNDVRERYKSSPITIIYYGTIIVILNSFNSHFIEIILSVIFRKFKILIPVVLDKNGFSDYNSFLLDLGFDKGRDVKGDVVAKSNLEDYLEILDAYSMLFFAIVGVDIKKLSKKFGNVGKFMSFNVLGNYLDFLENLMKLEYWKFPFISVVLKNYILASSEVFENNKSQMLENFGIIKKVVIPKLKHYIKNQAKIDFPLLNKKENIKELEISMMVLEKELQKILIDRKVIDKFVKYEK